ncbi:MAG: hypothetical protein JWM02_2053 [Frankiales bacterium]|nr:hypothetical protein [Frankiales bacterium]
MQKPFPVTQVSDLSRWDRLRFAWRDYRYGDQQDVFSSVPPGHFYSPVPSLLDVQQRSEEIFSVPRDLPGIDLRAAAQLELARELAPLVQALPFAPDEVPGLRYWLSNPYFYTADGAIYAALLQLWRPSRIVEVGSGFSTAVLLDMVDLHGDVRPRITCIDPYPQRLRGLLRPSDDVEILECGVQDVNPALFTGLTAGDLLFIDSTHVSKVGSDVNYLFLEVLSRLPAGVHIHVHDVFYPFEYPREMVLGGMAWNEAYLLRGFLTHNARVRIDWWNSYLSTAHREEVQALMPSWEPQGCSSLWLTTT